MTNFLRSLMHMPISPWSQPLITCPCPSVNSNGELRSKLESNFSPVEYRVPV